MAAYDNLDARISALQADFQPSTLPSYPHVTASALNSELADKRSKGDAAFDGAMRSWFFALPTDPTGLGPSRFQGSTDATSGRTLARTETNA